MGVLETVDSPTDWETDVRATGTCFCKSRSATATGSDFRYCDRDSDIDRCIFATIAGCNARPGVIVTEGKASDAISIAGLVGNVTGVHFNLLRQGPYAWVFSTTWPQALQYFLFCFFASSLLLATQAAFQAALELIK